MDNKLLVCEDIYKSYGKKEVLKGVNLTIEPAKIYGLIGRNGVGKTTLLSVLTAQAHIKKGTVLYGGEKVWENENALRHICFSREIPQTLLNGPNNIKVKQYLKMASFLYENWDKELADTLIKDFNLDVKAKVSKLNKGALSIATIVIALASNCDITILDEPVAGLDVVMRDKFYSILLEIFQKTQRTFIISTHIIEEAANLLEEIIILNDGVITEKQNTEAFIEQFRYISGKDEVVDEISSKFEVLETEVMGKLKNVCVRCEDGGFNIENACNGIDVDVSNVPLQKIFVYLTKEKQS